MRINRWHQLATCIGLTFAFLISALMPYRWREVSAAGPEQTVLMTSLSARDEFVTSQPRSFKKARLGLERKQVKGAPFSAELTIETPEYSTGGRSRSAVMQSFVYRDIEGRTRREQKPESGAQNGEIATISDFVAGLTYVLEPRLQVARKRALQAITDDSDSEVDINSMRSRPNGRYQILPSGSTSTGADSSSGLVGATSLTTADDSPGKRERRAPGIIHHIHQTTLGGELFKPLLMRAI
jgi:hypothetical protein